MTHAKARFLRRLKNRELGRSNPDFGKPIPGELSPVEVAHKQRRMASRHFNLQKRKRQAEGSVIAIQSDITQLTGASSNENRTKEERLAIQSKIRGLELVLSSAKQRLSAVEKSLGLLHS